MNKNYKIKSNYKPNKKIKTIDTNIIRYWTNWRISRSYYSRYYLFKKNRHLIKKLKINSVIDIGCGTAIKLMKFLYPVCHEIYEIDQEHIIKICRIKYGLDTFIVDNIEKSKIDLKKKFDLVICTDVIEHLSDPDKLLNYIKRFSHKNTIIMITTPERDTLRGNDCNHCPKPDHIREWNKFEFNKYLKSRGFKILHHNLIDNFKVMINMKHSFNKIKNDFLIQIPLIKKFNTIRKIRHTQLVISTLSNTHDNKKQFFKKIFKTNALSDFINSFLIKIYLLISKFYYYYNIPHSIKYGKKK